MTLVFWNLLKILVERNILEVEKVGKCNRYRLTEGLLRRLRGDWQGIDRWEIMAEAGVTNKTSPQSLESFPPVSLVMS